MNSTSSLKVLQANLNHSALVTESTLQVAVELGVGLVVGKAMLKAQRAIARDSSQAYLKARNCQGLNP